MEWLGCMQDEADDMSLSAGVPAVWFIPAHSTLSRQLSVAVALSVHCGSFNIIQLYICNICINEAHLHL